MSVHSACTGICHADLFRCWESSVRLPEQEPQYPLLNAGKEGILDAYRVCLIATLFGRAITNDGILDSKLKHSVEELNHGDITHRYENR